MQESGKSPYPVRQSVSPVSVRDTAALLSGTICATRGEGGDARGTPPRPGDAPWKHFSHFSRRGCRGCHAQSSLGLWERSLEATRRSRRPCCETFLPRASHAGHARRAAPGSRSQLDSLDACPCSLTSLAPSIHHASYWVHAVLFPSVPPLTAFSPSSVAAGLAGVLHKAHNQSSS